MLYARGRFAKRGLIPALTLGLLLACSGVAFAHESGSGGGGSGTPPKGHQSMMNDGSANMAAMHRLKMPQMDPAKGRLLFASKGCVACHSVNGVGGHDATALDAHTMDSRMNPFEFAAKMWRMAPAMIYAQEEAMGEQILFTGDEIANIIAFVHDDEEQHHFSEADIPPEIENMMHHSHGTPSGTSSGTEEHGPEIGHGHHGGGHHSGSMMKGTQ